MQLPFRFRFSPSLALCCALGMTAVAFVFSCHSSHSSPTQPVTNPSPTPVGMVPTPTPMGAVPTPTPQAAAHMVNVGQGGNNFLDQQSGNSTTTIKAGQTVQWNWVGSFHSSTSGNCCTPDGNWDSGVMSNGTFSHTFPTAGNFPYFCTVHGSLMTGMVVVTP